MLAHTRRHPLALYLVGQRQPGRHRRRALEQAVASGALRPGPEQSVQVICRRRNGGFGAGHNTVLDSLASDYHFILNPDILLTADTLSDLAEWMEALAPGGDGPARPLLSRRAAPGAAPAPVQPAGHGLPGSWAFSPF